MDYKRREEIFAKDYITTKEIQELLGFKCQSQASQMIMKIKRVVGDKLGVKGKIHTEDYFAYFCVQPKDRYNQVTQDRELGETENQKYNPLTAGNREMIEKHRQIFREKGIIK